MKFVEMVVAGLAFLTGMTAAWYWHRASRVTADPGWGRDGLVEPGVHSVAQDAWIAALIQSASESARLNKIAAVWTAATALLAAIASVLSVAHT